MEIIYTDSNHVEQGYLYNAEADFDLGDTNDFQIKFPLSEKNIIQDNAIIYIYDTEFGGIVKRITSDTNQNYLYYGGYTWRGMLQKKIIEPDVGKDYLTVSGTFQSVINLLLKRHGLDGMFYADSVNISFSEYSFSRYGTLLDEIVKMLKTQNKKIILRYLNEKVIVSCSDIVDYSDDIEITQDSNITFKIEKRKDYVNHLICLGKGELKDRQVVHLFCNGNGEISETQTFFDTGEITEIYDYSSVESLDELKNSGIEELQKRRKESAISLNISDNIGLDLGDIVRAYDKITKMEVKREITSKIVKISNDITKFSYKVGDE